MASNTCEVCCEKYNKKNRKLVECCACQYGQCQQCVKTYILGLKQIEPRCMNCNVEWKMNFLKTNLTKTFLQKEYKQHQGDIIFDQERQHFPELMNEIDQENQKNQLCQLEDQTYNMQMKLQQIIDLKQIEKQIHSRDKSNIRCPICTYFCKQQKEKISCIRCEQQLCNICLDIKEVDEEHKCTTPDKDLAVQIESQIKKCREEYNSLEKMCRQIQTLKSALKREPTSQKKIYYIQCPRNECNGLVDNETSICGICEAKICKKCNEQEEEGHECKQENIESAKIIRNQCRQCPKCRANIYRIHGCNHMFCTVCKTSFDWVSGEVIKKTTNPHYYEYIRQNNIQVVEEEEDLCDDNLVNINRLCNFLQDFFKKKHKEYVQITDIHQKINHTEQIELRKLEENDRTYIRGQCKLYLRNQLTKDELKDKLQKRRKQEEKKKNLYQILQAYVQVSKKEINDILQQTNKQDIIRKIQIIKNFENYMIQQIEQTKKDFDSKMKTMI